MDMKARTQVRAVSTVVRSHKH